MRRVEPLLWEEAGIKPADTWSSAARSLFGVRHEGGATSRARFLSRRLMLAAVAVIGACALGLALATSGRPPAQSERRLGSRRPSLPPLPFIYVSFHGNHRKSPTPRQGVNQIYRYALGADSDGAHVHVLKSTRAEPTRLLRGMLVDPASGDLFVANAYYDDSKLLRFGACDADGRRELLTRVAPTVATSELVHPYGLAMLAGKLYATTQDTGAIVGYDLREPSVRALESAMHFGAVSGADPVAFRGLASAGECLYAAEEGSAVVLELCGGVVRAAIPIKKPIGVLVDASRQLLFVGSRYRRDPRVVAFDLATHEVVGEFRLEGMTHPAGLAVDGDALYVADQTSLRILHFDIPTSAFVRVVVDQLPDDPEWISLSPC